MSKREKQKERSGEAAWAVETSDVPSKGDKEQKGYQGAPLTHNPFAAYFTRSEVEEGREEKDD